MLRHVAMWVKENQGAERILPVRSVLLEAPEVRGCAVLSDDESVPHGYPVQHRQRPPGFAEPRLDQHRPGSFGHIAIALLRPRCMPPRDGGVVGQRTPLSDSARGGHDFSGAVAPPPSDDWWNIVEPMNSLMDHFLSIPVGRCPSPKNVRSSVKISDLCAALNASVPRLISIQSRCTIAPKSVSAASGPVTPTNGLVRLRRCLC